VHGLLAGRMTRSRSIGLIVALAGFSVPFVVKEPMHPVGICTLLVVLIIASAAWGNGLDARRGAILAGIAVGALAMIKINMGALAHWVLGAILLTGAPISPVAHAMRRVAAGLLLISPLLLMSGDFGQGWATETLVMMLGAVAAIVVQAWPTTDTVRHGPKLQTLLVWIAGAGAATVALTVIGIVIAGTPPSAVHGCC